MRITLTLESAFGYALPMVTVGMGSSLVDALRMAYPYTSIFSTIESNGLKVTGVTFEDSPR